MQIKSLIKSKLINYIVASFKYDILNVLTKKYKNELMYVVKTKCKEDLKLTNEVIKEIIPDDMPVIMNITVTSDILEYNKVYEKVSILNNNKVKKVSDRQSFVYNPSNTTYVN